MGTRFAGRTRGNTSARDEGGWVAPPMVGPKTRAGWRMVLLSGFPGRRPVPPRETSEPQSTGLPPCGIDRSPPLDEGRPSGREQDRHPGAGGLHQAPLRRASFDRSSRSTLPSHTFEGVLRAGVLTRPTVTTFVADRLSPVPEFPRGSWFFALLVLWDHPPPLFSWSEEQDPSGIGFGTLPRIDPGSKRVGPRRRQGEGPRPRGARFPGWAKKLKPRVRGPSPASTARPRCDLGGRRRRGRGPRAAPSSGSHPCLRAGSDPRRGREGAGWTVAHASSGIRASRSCSPASVSRYSTRAGTSA